MTWRTPDKLASEPSRYLAQIVFLALAGLPLNQCGPGVLDVNAGRMDRPGDDRKRPHCRDRLLRYREIRQTAELQLARLLQLVIRQARYFERRRTLFQLLMAATVANLTLVANKTEQRGSQRSQSLSSPCSTPTFSKSIWNHRSHLELNLTSIL